jgi:hypothetical protein
MGTVDRIASIALAIIVVGGITAVVTRPESARIIGATGQAFTNALRTAISGK